MAKMESGVTSNTLTSCPQSIEVPDVMIMYPIEAPPMPGPAQGIKNVGANKPVLTNTNLGMLTENMQLEAEKASRANTYSPYVIEGPDVMISYPIVTPPIPAPAQGIKNVGANKPVLTNTNLGMLTENMQLEAEKASRANTYSPYVIEGPDVMISYPILTPPIPAPAQGIKNVGANKPVLTNTNLGMPTGNMQLEAGKAARANTYSPYVIEGPDVMISYPIVAPPIPAPAQGIKNIGAGKHVLTNTNLGMPTKNMQFEARKPATASTYSPYGIEGPDVMIMYPIQPPPMQASAQAIFRIGAGKPALANTNFGKPAGNNQLKAGKAAVANTNTEIPAANKQVDVDKPAVANTNIGNPAENNQVEAGKSAEANTNTGKPVANNQVGVLKGVSKVNNGPAKTNDAKKQSESEKKSIFVKISRHASKVTFARTKAIIRLYSAFMKFFIIMNIGLLLLLIYLTHKSAVVDFVSSTREAVAAMVDSGVIISTALFVTTVVAQVYLYFSIMKELRRD